MLAVGKDVFCSCSQGSVFWFKVHGARPNLAFLSDGSTHLFNCLTPTQQIPLNSVLLGALGRVMNWQIGTWATLTRVKPLWKQRGLWVALSHQWQLRAHLFGEMAAKMNTHNLWAGTWFLVSVYSVRNTEWSYLLDICSMQISVTNKQVLACITSALTTEPISKSKNKYIFYQEKEKKRRRMCSALGQWGDSPATAFTLRANLAWPNQNRSGLFLIKCSITQNEANMLPISPLSSRSEGEERKRTFPLRALL